MTHAVKGAFYFAPLSDMARNAVRGLIASPMHALFECRLEHIGRAPILLVRKRKSIVRFFFAGGRRSPGAHVFVAQ
jgi:hypothetical protein